MYYLEIIHGIDLTEIKYFRSHFDNLGLFGVDTLKDQVTLSYNLANNNVVKIKSEPNDPTR